MRQIISIIYGVLLIAIWICVMGIVIAVLDSGGPKWLLLAGGFVAAVSTVALVEEFLDRPQGRRSEHNRCRPQGQRRTSKCAGNNGMPRGPYRQKSLNRSG